MIPLKDSAPRERFPIVTLALIVINLAVFIHQLSLDQNQLVTFIYTFGTVPREITEGFLALLSGNLQSGALPTAFFSLISANFLHGGWLHLLGNMIYLWVFGDNIEGRLGHGSYLLLYLLMGAGSQLLHILSAPLSPIPLVGASGAIAGILGAYFIIFPRARVLTLVPLGFFITFMYIPAVVFLALWFVLQLINAVFTGPAMGVQAVAWWAHVGGFAVGLVVGIMAPKYNYYHP